jgi:hypothetical protein
MQIVVFAALAGIFLLLTLLRVGGARRAILLQRWPAVALGLAAGFELVRGGVWLALGLGGAAVIAWAIAPSQVRSNAAAGPIPEDPRDIEARAILGVGPKADAAEIRAAFRTKMAHAHPDRGGAHADAVRLIAARDRLLKR